MPRHILPLTLATLLAACPALAQDGWSYKASGYLWATGITTGVDTKLGWVSAETSFSDVLQNLDIALMGTFEADHGPWSLILDGMYSELSNNVTFPNRPVFQSMDAAVSTKIASAYALYRLHDDPKLTFDAGVGLRATSLDMDIGITRRTVLPGGSNTSAVDIGTGTTNFSLGDTWVDPLVAARVRYAFNDQWFGAVFADAGGTGGYNTTWQVAATVGYSFNERWSVQGGYRYMNIEHELDRTNMRLEQYGPILGVTYSF